jgi:hypothetical protein
MPSYQNSAEPKRTWTPSYVRFPGDDALPWFVPDTMFVFAPPRRPRRGRRPPAWRARAAVYASTLAADDYLEAARGALRDGDDDAVRKPAPLGSLEAWSNIVRGALLRLDCADPVATMAEVRASDPETSQLRQVMAAWREAFKNEDVTVSPLVKKAMEQQRANSFEGRL